MILGGANVWSNFSYGSRIDTPNGCLLNAEGSRLIFFQRSKKSPKNNIRIFTHLFYTNHLGEPAGLKSTSQICLEEAWEQWHKLQEQGWTAVSHNFG
tara:strand:- start:303 stop:593 length:291 start_codon:yes stop_codon:yes gene_type:complete